MTRDEIVAETLTWLGTPYRHQASLKGVGCDCLGLVRGVWRALVGPRTGGGAGLYAGLGGGGRGRATARGRRPVSDAGGAAEAGAGDVLLFRWAPGCPAKHAGILIRADRFVHAHEGARVAEAPLGRWWRARTAGVWRFPGVAG